VLPPNNSTRIWKVEQTTQRDFEKQNAWIWKYKTAMFDIFNATNNQWGNFWCFLHGNDCFTVMNKENSSTPVNIVYSVNRFSNVCNSTVGYTHLCAWDWQKLVPQLISKPKTIQSWGWLNKQGLLHYQNKLVY